MSRTHDPTAPIETPEAFLADRSVSGTASPIHEGLGDLHRHPAGADGDLPGSASPSR